MNKAFVINYFNIKSFEEFDEALVDIENKINLNSEQFPKNSIIKLKENIQKVREWAREYLESEFVLDPDDYEDDENGGPCDYNFSCVDFKFPCDIDGRIEIGPKFREKNNIESCYPYAEFYASAYSFSITVEGVAYKLYN